MKVLITGSGFVAKALIQNVPEGMEVTLASRHKPNLDVNFIQNDWAERPLSLKTDVVFHTAWANDRYKDAAMIDNLKYLNCPVIFCSSGSAIEESDYGYLKRFCEFLLKGHTIARLYSFIGPDLLRHAPFEFIKEGLSGGPITIKGTGETLRSYLYQDEMADLLWKLPNKSVGSYGIGSCIPIRLIDVAEYVAKKFNTEVKILNGPD